MEKETVVISVGGSLISPDGIDVAFLKRFKEIIVGHVEEGMSFLIITGGGATSRTYQDAARAVGDLDTEDLDWLGIHATRLNGHLLLALFRKHAHPVLITNPEKLQEKASPVIIAAGWKPGRSTDHVAAILAERIGARRLVNLSNIDFVYTKDPKKHDDAEPIKEISWSDFRKLLPKSWDPGIHAPFDPVASTFAQKLGLEVAIINGGKLEEFENYLSGEEFVGTVIR